MTLAQTPTTRSTVTKAFHFLFVMAWLCVGVLGEWDLGWLDLLVGLALIAALTPMLHTSTCAVAGRAIVAQVANLLYRRLPVGRASSTTSTVADWKSAIPQVGNLRYGFTTAFVCERLRQGVSRQWPALL